MTTARLARAAALLVAAATLLPGRPAPPSLEADLRRAAAALGPRHVLRTRHRHPDGSPRYVNRLVREASPYLLQHAHNPVDWYAWGPEAFARAAAERKPVFLSIGYSTCHWCHVMEEESFEDETIAAYLNANYVAIKVDREVRPDLDALYMTAVQAMGVSGGWPLNVWLTPDARPFYGGTYFPPRDGDRPGRIGFLPLLKKLRAVYDAEPARVADAAADVVQRVTASLTPAPSDTRPGTSALSLGYRLATRDFDEDGAGFGRAPKFPRPDQLAFLLRYHRRTGEAHARDMVVRTLDAMARGGIRDHLGGGFHRYSTDAAWRVPHFEKMLYDNALLAMVYLEAAQATGRRDLGLVAREILDYLARDMTAADGTFYAATDADSDGEEGRYFTWTADEITAAVGPEAARIAIAYYAVEPSPTLDGRSVLSTPQPLSDTAATLGLSPEATAAGLEAARAGLVRARGMRTPPHTDRKIIAAWNGLAISAFARAGAAFDDAGYTARAVRAADRILETFRRGDRLAHHALGGCVEGSAFLDDYAFLEGACLDLFEATGRPRWLEEALTLQRTLDAHFADEVHGGYFATPDDGEVLLAREKPTDDGAMPSGNAVALENLLRLGSLTTDDAYDARADRLLIALGKTLMQRPLAAPRLLTGLERRLDVTKEIVIVTQGDRDQAAPLLARLGAAHVPNRVLAVVAIGAPQQTLGALVPLVTDKVAIDGLATAYVCEHRVCRLPVTDADAFAGALAKIAPLP